MDITQFLDDEGWEISTPLEIPERKGQIYNHNELELSTPTAKYLRKKFPAGLYRHQIDAISQGTKGIDVCMLTSTASGKSVPFYATGIELLCRDKNARVIAIYPLKALGREQEERWKAALQASGLDISVGRIDGGVSINKRLSVLQKSSVVIMTPDVIHAWLLTALSEPLVRSFLKNLRLIILDEIHTYTGVFGSNAALLLRRLQHVSEMLGARFQYLCASATMANPEQHLKSLIGRSFSLVLPECDSSPKPAMTILLARPANTKDQLSSISSLLVFLAQENSSRFICFVDSRKQTEHISAISSRVEDQIEDDSIEHSFDRIRKYNMLPYRSGYEEYDRDLIQKELTNGNLHGVVSTSALEMGIDIPGLNVGVLVGVPQSSTSLYQRIGRVGRDSQGVVIVVNTGNLLDEHVFADPKLLFNRPLQEGALYLENRRIQYIHTMCLARPGGEHDITAESIGKNITTEIFSTLEWPDGFLTLCTNERLGQLPADLQDMKMQGGDSPNHVFPLRDVEAQYQIKIQNTANENLGSLSYSQLMREAYPGAVYYHITQPYRVARVLQRDKIVTVRPEKRYFTKPTHLPTLVYPNLSEGNIYRSEGVEQFIAVECNLQIHEALCGFREHRGSNEIAITYPTNSAVSGVFFNLTQFTHNFFTTGTIISHPVLEAPGVKIEKVAGLLYEAFVIQIPFERRDVNYAYDKYRQAHGPIHEGNRFVAIYDQTYGSLRLSGALMEAGVMKQVLNYSIELARLEDSEDTVTISVLETLAKAAREPLFDRMPELQTHATTYQDGDLIRVIKPGSKGWSEIRGNVEFLVEDVFYRPGGLAYRGRYQDTYMNDTIILPLESVIEIPGESTMGFFNSQTGEVKDL